MKLKKVWKNYFRSEVLKEINTHDEINKYMKNKDIKKIFFIKNKLINILVGE